MHRLTHVRVGVFITQTKIYHVAQFRIRSIVIIIHHVTQIRVRIILTLIYHATQV